MDEIKKMLDEEIKDEILDLKGMQSGTDEKSMAIDDLAKLYKLRIEETKNHKERKLELEESKQRYIKYGLEAAGIILPLMFNMVWMYKGFKFEEKGTFASTTFRSLFNRFRLTK